MDRLEPRAEPTRLCVMTGPVLVVDDDRDVLHAARLALAGEAARVETSLGIDRLEDILKADVYEVVLLDMNFALGE
jgi:two-component system, NtrC family, response regulator HydG